MAVTFELYSDKKGEFRWRLRDQNGNVVAESGDSFQTKDSAQNGINLVMQRAPAAAVEDAA